jgi:cob(I)alamin adenosyltransferase
MVVLNRIYTRTGDGGRTRLADGSEVAKTDPRVEAYGAVDETNACLGLVRLHTEADGRLHEILGRIQNDLFDLGADLATPAKPDEAPGQALRVTAGQVTRLEAEIDEMNAAIAPLNSFVLPGGTPAAAHLHLARTVCRRAERAAVALASDQAVRPEALKYLNRLSDLLFVASRRANQNGAEDVLWVPGAGRT